MTLSLGSKARAQKLGPECFSLASPHVDSRAKLVVGFSAMALLSMFSIVLLDPFEFSARLQGKNN